MSLEATGVLATVGRLPVDLEYVKMNLRDSLTSPRRPILLTTNYDALQSTWLCMYYPYLSPNTSVCREDSRGWYGSTRHKMLSQTGPMSSTSTVVIDSSPSKMASMKESPWDGSSATRGVRMIHHYGASCVSPCDVCLVYTFASHSILGRSWRTPCIVYLLVSTYACPGSTRSIALGLRARSPQSYAFRRAIKHRAVSHQNRKHWP